MGIKSSTPLETIAGEPYLKCRVLGKGSFGKVYAMQHVTTETFRVVKEIHKGTVVQKGKTVLKLLINERQLLSHVKGCPYVVKCYAAFQDENFLYILMEFCSGGELEFHLRHFKTFGEDIIRCYLAQLTIGLDTLHTKYRVVHRDIKPENVLLDAEGYCAIVDFNMGIRCDENCNIPNPKKHIIGTLPYIAPELIRGNDHTNKVDYWSLGILAYELAHGIRPFHMTKGEGTSENSKMLDHITKTVPKLDQILAETLSSSFKDLIKGLLCIDPAKRFGATEIKAHKFFKGINWQDVKDKKIKSMFVPREDRINFGADSHLEEAFGISKPQHIEITSEQQAIFSEWDWQAEDQDLPTPDPELVLKYQRKYKKANSHLNTSLSSSSSNALGTSANNGNKNRQKDIPSEDEESDHSKERDRKEKTIDKSTEDRDKERDTSKQTGSAKKERRRTDRVEEKNSEKSKEEDDEDQERKNRDKERTRSRKQKRKSEDKRDRREMSMESADRSKEDGKDKDEEKVRRSKPRGTEREKSEERDEVREEEKVRRSRTKKDMSKREDRSDEDKREEKSDEEEEQKPRKQRPQRDHEDGRETPREARKRQQQQQQQKTKWTSRENSRLKLNND